MKDAEDPAHREERIRVRAYQIWEAEPYTKAPGVFRPVAINSPRRATGGVYWAANLGSFTSRRNGTALHACKTRRKLWTACMDAIGTETGELSKKHGNTLVRTLGKVYGQQFAEGCSPEET
jgi:hypothetical protein